MIRIIIAIACISINYRIIFCTPGMIMTAADLLQNNPAPTEEEIRAALEGNFCRCTGYHNIVKSVQYAAEKMKEVVV